MSSDTQTDVVVVGGGFAGIAAAITLQTQLRVRVLEAGELGGRVCSQQLEDGGVVELGAQYLGRRHKRLMGLLDELDMLDQLVDYVPGFGPDPVAVCRLAGRRVVTRRSETYFQIQGLDARAAWPEQARFLTALATIAAMCAMIDARDPASNPVTRWLDAISYAEYVGGFELPDWFADLLYSGVRCVWSQHPEQMSALYVLWYIKTNGGFWAIFNDQDGSPQQYGVRCGLGTVLQRWAGRLHRAPELGCGVRCIEAEDERVLVTSAAGERIACQQVIVAMGPRAAGKISYSPALPPERELLHAQRGGFAIKALVFYAEAWWREGVGAEDHVFAWLNGKGHAGIDWILDASDAEPCLVCFVSPELFDGLPQRDPASLEAAILAGIEALSQDPRARHSTRLVARDWREVPGVWAGPNTNFAPGVLTRVAGQWREPDHGRIYFAGAEYAHSFTGYVEGAIASGQDVAQQLLAARAPTRRTPWRHFITRRRTQFEAKRQSSRVTMPTSVATKA